MIISKKAKEYNVRFPSVLITGKPIDAKIFLKDKTDPKIMIEGKKKYVENMYKHLKKEHPSTKKRMKMY